MRIVIVAKTRMRADRICVGAHDLATFRGLRLHRHDGSPFTVDSPLAIGELWDVHVDQMANIQPPHVEDVRVRREGAQRLGTQPDIASLIRERDEVWRQEPQLFAETLRFTAAGSAYVPVEGSLPPRSTGYWEPDGPLGRSEHDGSVRYRPNTGDQLLSIRYVGLEPALESIPSGTLLRLSLSRRFAPPDGPDGYWLQLSGWF